MCPTGSLDWTFSWRIPSQIQFLSQNIPNRSYTEIQYVECFSNMTSIILYEEEFYPLHCLFRKTFIACSFPGMSGVLVEFWRILVWEDNLDRWKVVCIKITSTFTKWSILGASKPAWSGWMQESARWKNHGLGRLRWRHATREKSCTLSSG